jgi:hypothetical protein
MRFASSVFLVAVFTFFGSSSLFAQHGRNAVTSPGTLGRAYPNSQPRAAGTPIQNLGGRAYPIRTDIPRPVGLNPPAASYTGILPGAYNAPPGNSGHGNRHGGGAVIAAPLFYPYLGYDPSISSIPSYNETIDLNAQAYAATQDALAEQIRQLSAELDSVKRQSFAPPPEAVAPQATPAATTSDPAYVQPPVSVVLKTGQQLSVQSYALMNGFFWDFSKQPVRKIPLSSIDLPASVKATEANGAEFPQVSSSRD